MIVVPASFKIEERNEIRGGIENIELAGRTCYKSEDKARLGNGDKFVANLIKHHHEAMLEHGDYIFMVKDAHIWEYIKNSVSLPGARPFMLNMTVMGDRRIISGNIRAWREFIRSRAAGAYFSGSIDPLYTADIAEDTKDWFEHTPDGRVERIFYNDLLYDKEQLAHLRQTVRFTVDRGVSHEIVRHRLFSLAQESTRFCVTGDTLIYGYGDKRWTVKELYDWQSDEERKSRLGLINVRSVDEETKRITKNGIARIIRIGEKPVFEITTKSGRKLMATADHPIFTPNGYKNLGELCVGDCVYVNGKELLDNEEWLRDYYITQNHTGKETAKAIGCSETYVYRALKKFGIEKPLSDRPNRKPGHGVKGMFSDEAKEKLREQKRGEKNPAYIVDRERLTVGGAYAECHRIYDSEREVCEQCGKRENIEIHHIDRNPRNNDRSNIKFLCTQCHHAWHDPGMLAVFTDEVVSIERKDTQTVYDVQMSGEIHNFVANGIVVHNCNYAMDKFGNQITCIKPCYLAEGTEEYDVWVTAMEFAESAYFCMLDKGRIPQEARAVLPTSLKTELVVTGNLAEWRHFFDLRAKQVTGAAHPQMVEVAVPLWEEMARKYPVLV